MWLRVVVGLVAVLALVVAGAYLFQRQLIYFPDPSDPGPAAEAVPGGRDVVLHTSDGLELGAWLAPAPASADRGMAVLYLPGNGGHRGGRVGIAGELVERGFAVLLVDYRGYGGNPGRPTEEGLRADARAAHEALLEEGYGADAQIFVGESLGGGVAAGLAASHPPAAMVLRSPFTQLADVGRHHYPFLPVGLLLRDEFPVELVMGELDVPVTVVRGSADQVVPTELSEQVAGSARELVEEVVLDGVGHNDAEMFGAPVADAVGRLADLVAGEG